MFDESVFRGLRVLVVLLLVGCLLYGSVLAFFGGSVMATGLSVSDGETTVDRGSLGLVSVDADVEVEWDGAEENPGDTEILLQVEKPGVDNGYETLDSHSEELNGAAGKYSYGFDSESVIDGDTSWSASDFKPSGDGQEKSTELEFRIVVSPSGDLDGDGSSSSFSSTATAVVSVLNEEASEESGGNIDVSADGRDKDPEDNKNPENDDD